MIPYDGFGYGKSTYWTYAAVIAAKKYSEECSCWEKVAPNVSIFGENGIKIKITCAMKDALCRKEFPKTEEEMGKTVRNFYLYENNI